MARSMQGKNVDMEKLMRQNELMPAVGNVRVNARGDELGAGGQIVRKREDVMAEYYEDNPKARPEVMPVQTKPQVAPVQSTQNVTSEPTVSTKRSK